VSRARGAWLVACAWLVVLACAPNPSNRIVEPLDPRAEIQQRMEAINSDVASLALPPQSIAMAAPAPTVSPRTCTAGPSQACQDVCKIDDSICGNAKRICELADQLAGDGWAAEQCAKAKQTCEASQQKCCACQT
jgi:hypothetical protein